jgi:hypothetical protein
MCCSGGEQKLRIAKVVNRQDSQPKRPTTQKLRVSKQTVRVADIERQAVVPRDRCLVCGYPTMVVYIANRERIQCSNPNCRKVV